MVYPDDVADDAPEEEILQAYVDQLGFTLEEARAYLRVVRTQDVPVM